MWFGLLVAYWAGLMLNASVDVFLEGPMGGIWYWSILGLGVASVWVFRHQPQVLHVPHAVPREVTAPPAAAAERDARFRVPARR
jgi:hypothetical protein